MTRPATAQPTRRFPLHIHITTLFLAMILLVGGIIAGVGSVMAYWQGHALHGTRFMGQVERVIPEGSLPRAYSGR